MARVEEGEGQQMETRTEQLSGTLEGAPGVTRSSCKLLSSSDLHIPLDVGRVEKGKKRSPEQPHTSSRRRQTANGQ